jgi:hypothetical protein
VKNADFFSLRKNWPPRDTNPDFYSGEPNDITLELIACIWSRLHMQWDPTALQPYILDEKEIQWFVNEYKRRIDEYILAVKKIDETVLASERMIYMITNWGKGPEGMIKYGHPYYGIPELYRRGNVLKEYYEQRLGISDLVVDYTAFRE